ncbi:hypothetical protein K438DRAFT_1658112 [Mycena galopus ATCC 62051]|nr:hypothetical protein K438DRAFT_1658112 [Mycena galopus ATCC 62051]
MTTNAKTFTDAPPPFDDPNADIIIRSSENVDFRMHKLLLALASPFFKEMFEVAQPMTTDEGEKGTLIRDGIPVIFLCDDQNQACGKDVVEFVLGSCHPARLQSSKPSLLAEFVGPVIDVATRYRFEWAIKTVLHDPHLLKTNPLLAFAHACHKEREADAALAAKESLRFHVDEFPRDLSLKLISGYQFQALVIFHRRCAQAAAVVAKGENATSWIPNETLKLFPTSHSPCSLQQSQQITAWNNKLGFPTSRYNLSTNSIQQWWNQYIETAAVQLESRPHSSTVSNSVLMDETFVKGSPCTFCVPRMGSFMRSFVPAFEQKIDDVIRQILEETTFI